MGAMTVTLGAPHEAAGTGPVAALRGHRLLLRRGRLYDVPRVVNDVLGGVPLDEDVHASAPEARARFDHMTVQATTLDDAERRNAEVIILDATGLKPSSVRRRDWIDPVAREVSRDADRRVMFIHETERAAA